MTFTQPHLLPILLLLGSNIFMTLAWYGHLRFKEQPLMVVILGAWAIAFVEYCMAVPANRAAQDDSGGDHPDRVCGFFGAVSEGAIHLELRGRLCVHRRRSVFRFQRAAVLISMRQTIQAAA